MCIRFFASDYIISSVTEKNEKELHWSTQTLLYTVANVYPFFCIRRYIDSPGFFWHILWILDSTLTFFLNLIVDTTYNTYHTDLFISKDVPCLTFSYVIQ